MIKKLIASLFLLSSVSIGQSQTQPKQISYDYSYCDKSPIEVPQGPNPCDVPPSVISACQQAFARAIRDCRQLACLAYYDAYSSYSGQIQFANNLYDYCLAISRGPIERALCISIRLDTYSSLGMALNSAIVDIEASLATCEFAAVESYWECIQKYCKEDVYSFARQDSTTFEHPSSPNPFCDIDNFDPPSGPFACRIDPAYVKKCQEAYSNGAMALALASCLTHEAGRAKYETAITKADSDFQACKDAIQIPSDLFKCNQSKDVALRVASFQWVYGARLIKRRYDAALDDLIGDYWKCIKKGCE